MGKQSKRGAVGQRMREIPETKKGHGDQESELYKNQEMGKGKHSLWPGDI